MLGLNIVSMSNDAIPLTCSDASTGYANHAKKRPRKLLNAPSTKYKGVVPQQNGHWGAQIYANHQRIWLGTFKSEKEAAMAYDSAALKLRSGESHRNIPWSVLTVEEPYFQKDYSTEAVLNMIRDGSYPSKFTDFVRSRSRKQEIGRNMNSIKMQGNGMFSFRLLFQKELTPSDVGKLNRLVIPKKYAVRYFPRISECDNEKENNKMEELLLNFHDGLMRSWKFRYCYWSSSQSFVFTRGWSRFVKEKELEANDIISFYICESTEKKANQGQFYLIDVAYKQGKNIARKAEFVVPCWQKMDSLDQYLKRSSYTDECENEVVGDKVMLGIEPQHKEKQSCLRLFGVDIN